MKLIDLVEADELLERVYRCSKGPRRGRLVTSPSLCADHTHTKHSKIMSRYFTNKRMMDKRGWYYER